MQCKMKSIIEQVVWKSCTKKISTTLPLPSVPVIQLPSVPSVPVIQLSKSI